MFSTQSIVRKYFTISVYFCTRNHVFKSSLLQHMFLQVCSTFIGRFSRVFCTILSLFIICITIFDTCDTIYVCRRSKRNSIPSAAGNRSKQGWSLITFEVFPSRYKHSRLETRESRVIGLFTGKLLKNSYDMKYPIIYTLYIV